MGPRAVTGLFSLGTSLLGGVMGLGAQNSANKTNIMLARENRAWEERMANSAYVRATQDMRNAGLNPMLAYSQGGAATPNVSAATVTPADALARSVSSAGDKYAQGVAIQKLIADTGIASENWEQQQILTEDMKNARGLTGGRATFWENQASEADLKKYQAAQAKLQNELGDLDKARKKIENEILEQTKGAQVKSAQEQANLLEKQVTYQELQTLLGRLDIPEKRAMAKWFETVGAASPATKAVMSITQWLKYILK